MRKDKTYLVRKYALFLVGLYALATTANSVLSEFIFNIESSNDIVMKALVYSGLFYFLNIVIAILVHKDIKILRIQARYAVLGTVLFAALGVCLFLLYVILDEAEKNEHAS